MSAALASQRLAARHGARDDAWARSALVELARRVIQELVVAPCVRALCRPLIVEWEAPLPAGPCILVANHASHLDAPAILAALPGPVRVRTAPAAAEDYFYRGRLLGAAVTLALGAIAFPRDRGCRQGLTRAAALLADGRNVLLFPEGTRSPDGRLGPFRPGAVRLAFAAGCPIVPIGIAGTAGVLPRGAALPRPGRIALRFGRAWFPDPALGPDRTADQLRGRVAALVEHIAEGANR